MTKIPPTTAIDADAGESPCCGADLVLSSPPHGYECRDCTRPYDLVGSDVIDVEAEVEGDGSDGGDEPAEGDESGETSAPLAADAEDMIERGECPWCSDYTGDHVGRHASSAHPDEWNAYKNDE